MDIICIFPLIEESLYPAPGRHAPVPNDDNHPGNEPQAVGWLALRVVTQLGFVQQVRCT